MNAAAATLSVFDDPMSSPAGNRLDQSSVPIIEAPLCDVNLIAGKDKQK